MGNIIRHIFSKKERIPVYKTAKGKEIIGYLSLGDWMGMIKDLQTKAQIVSAKIDGWVNKSDIVENIKQITDFNICYNNGEIRYFLSA